MATRGVVQLQKLVLHYCEHGGSSQAVRDYLASGKLIDWATARPSVQIIVKVRNGKHPVVHAEYLSQPKQVQHQICLKSNHARQPDVQGILDKLYNRSGRKIKRLGAAVLTQTPSIQGAWTPALDLHLQPPFAMRMVDGAASSSGEGQAKNSTSQ